MENNYTEDIRAEQNGEPEPLYKDSALKGFLIFLYILHQIYFAPRKSKMKVALR